MAGKAARAALWLGAFLAAQVEIEYWQYTFAQRVQAVDELIKRFEAANPGIKVKHTQVPYDDFRIKIAAAIPAGQGPDVVQLFYGWLQDYLKAGLLLDYCLQEIGPAVYSQAIADAQSYFTGRVADLEGVCHEEEFGYWPRR